MKRKAFTLIELLVVISIIALLVSIIMPSFNKVKKLSKRVICSTNLKAIGTGWVMYLDENKSQLPYAVSLPIDREDTNPNQPWLDTILVKQVENPETWHCPDDDQDYFKKYRTSYEYWPGLLMTPPSQPPEGEDPNELDELEKRLQALMVAAFGAAADRMNPSNREELLPVLSDAAAFHPTADDPLGRISMYYDGHVDMLNLPSDVPDDQIPTE